MVEGGWYDSPALKTLYRASRVYTLAPQPAGEWVLVDERHVERVGSGDPPPADRVVDLPGTTVTPGFVDAHVHLSGTGMSMDGPDLAAAESRDRLLDRIKEHASRLKGPLLLHGFDETRWPDQALPSLEELDRASSEALLVLRADGYVGVANGRFLEDSGAGTLPGAEEGGVLRGEANARGQLWYFESLSDSVIQDAQLRAAGLAASRGVTCVHEMAIPDRRGRRDVEVLLGHASELPVEVVTYVADTDIPYVMDLGQPRIGGDLFLDGSIGARTAALLEPYSDSEGTGSLAHDDDELAEFLHNAHLAGLQTGLHVIGDAAVDQSLRVWERVYRSLDTRERRHFRARRHRLEHFELASTDQVERAANLGLAISIQPAFDATWGHPGQMYELRLGEDRARGMNPFRAMVSRGLEVGSGSDSPVTPLDPMLAVWALESHHDPTQRMGREEALRLCTVGSARLAHLEKKGRLEPGASADLAAFEQDPLEVDDVRDVRPVLTVSRGREVYAR
ncbi:MAG: amidohydrolase [Actinomycetota bacterium]